MICGEIGVDGATSHEGARQPYNGWNWPNLDLHYFNSLPSTVPEFCFAFYSVIVWSQIGKMI